MLAYWLWPSLPLLVLVGMGGPPSPSPSTSISLEPKMWNILYSPAMPAHPTAAGSSWYFDFPNCGGTSACSVNYVVAPVLSISSRQVAASFQIATTGNPVFHYHLAPNNTCTYPAHVRLLIERKNDPMTAQAEFYRWWSSPVAYELAAGGATLTAPVIADQWMSVLGKLGNSSWQATAGFNTAVRDLGSVGLAFGGGCFYGHGVNVSGGTARFTLTGYSVDNP